MRIVDLTHTITPNMPVYPGDEPPCLTPVSTCAADGFAQTRIAITSHTGTHVDAQAHIAAQGAPLYSLGIQSFAGRALVIDCRGLLPGQDITMSLVSKYGDKAVKADFLLFNTGFSELWGRNEYFGEYPCVDDDVIDFVLSTGKKGVGFDVIGIDPVSSHALARHKRLLSRNDIVNIENLANLDQCTDELFWLFALPLKIAAPDGAPVRAIAFWED